MRQIAAVLSGIASGAGAYAICESGRVPMCWYDFLHRAWGFGFLPAHPTMAFYGRLAWALLAAALGALAGSRIVGRRMLIGCFVAALAVMAGAAGFSVLSALEYQPRPLPLPAGCRAGEPASPTG